MSYSDESSTTSSVQRREFLKRTMVVAWSTPLIMTIMSETALAQSPSCGTLGSGNPASTRRCADNPACTSPTKPVCCGTSTTIGSACNCYPSTTSAGVVTSTCV